MRRTTGTVRGWGRIAAPSLLAAVTLAACAEDPSSPAGRDDGAAAHPTARIEIVDRDEDRFLSGALSLLTQRCMAEAGFEYVPTDPDELADADDAAPEPQYAFQPPAADTARTDGYGIWRTAQQAAGVISTDRRQLELLERLTPVERERFDRTLAGPPLPDGTSPVLGGCYGEAARQVVDDPAAWDRAGSVVANLEATVNHRMRSNEELLALELEWARCMHEAGFPVNTVSDAYELAQRLYPPEPPSSDVLADLRAQEAAIAVADATCSADSGLRAAAARVHDDVVEQVLEEADGEIVAYRAMHEEAVRRARALVGER